MIQSWRKSSRSASKGECVEVGFTTDAERVGVRDTKDRGAGHFEVSRSQWSAFVDRVKGGSFPA